MDNFIKITTGWAQQYYKRNEKGKFVCTKQEFEAGDIVEYTDSTDFPLTICYDNPPKYQYQPYEMI